MSGDSRFTKPRVSDAFFSTFIGMYAEILAQIEAPDKTGSVLPMVIHAYILDADDLYYYLGTNPLEISSAIKQDSVQFIQRLEEIDAETQVLMEMPTPKSEEDVQ